MAADYPSGLTSKALMGQAQDNISSTINQAGGIANNSTTVTLASASAFPTSGYIQADTETMKYTGKSSNDLTGLTRGLFGTTAAAHANGVTVELTNSAGYIDELQEEVIALQTKLGVDTSAVTTTLDFLAKSATAHVTLSANQSVADGTWTKITFDTETYDVGSNFNTSNNRFVAPVAGKYLVTAGLLWASNATSERGIGIYVNGVQTYVQSTMAITAAGANSANNISVVMQLAATDYVEIYGVQRSGGALNANTSTVTFFSTALIKL